jgi:hypothetical protein
VTGVPTTSARLRNRAASFADSLRCSCAAVISNPPAHWSNADSQLHGLNEALPP